MSKNNEQKSKKKFVNVYLTACLVSICVGILTFAAAKTATKSVFDTNQQTVKIPPLYEEELKEEKEPENSLKAVENNEIQTEEVVNVLNITEDKDEKDISFTTPCDGTLQKRFSKDKPIKSKTMGDFRIHNGIDIKSTLGNSVYAALDGVVEKIYDDRLLGITIKISHDENLKTYYSNMAGADMVEEGQEIKKGDCIGCVGDTAIGEKLDEAHLHFAVEKNGEFVNPEDYIEIESN